MLDLVIRSDADLYDAERDGVVFDDLEYVGWEPDGEPDDTGEADWREPGRYHYPDL